MSKYTIRIESTPPSREILPWMTITRRGRQSVETQCFALLGYAKEDLADLAGPILEQSRDALTLAMRLMSAFEYIPADAPQADSFFEKKILGFEERLNAEYPDIPRLHAVVGIVQGTRVLFATSGDMLALQITPASITNLAEVGADGPLHFDTFRSGNLNQQSLLLFIPKTFGTLLKSDELKNLHSAKSSERKLEYLEHLGEKRSTGSESFHALLFEAKPKLIKTTETTAVSIAHLLATESNTEDLLSPPLLRPLMARLKLSLDTLSTKLQGIRKSFALENRTVRARPSSPIPKPKTRPAPKVTVTETEPEKEPELEPRGGAPISAPRTLSSSLMHLSAWGKTTFNSKTANIKTRIQLKPATLFARLRSKIPHSFEDMVQRFNLLPQGSKLLFLLGVILVFAFAQGVLLTVRAATIRNAEAALQNELSGIRTLINEASAALIYTDEEKARAQLEEAKARIANFPAFQAETISKVSLARFRRETYIPKSALEEISSSIAPLQKQLRHAISIDTPTPIDPGAKNVPPLKDEIPTSVIFRRRLYELASPLNQIIKHEPKTGGGFDEGKPWITDGSDLSKMKTLTIDGSIYLTDGKNTVAEFLKGKKTNFALKSSDPPVTAIKKIWTDENSDYLYVLDSSEKHLVVFYKKDGLLKVQYESPQFTDLKDFAIDERAKIAYLLDGTTTVSIPLSH